MNDYHDCVGVLGRGELTHAALESRYSALRNRRDGFDRMVTSASRGSLLGLRGLVKTPPAFPSSPSSRNRSPVFGAV